VFTGRVGKLDVAKAAGLTNIRLLKDNGDGTALYAIDLAH
jgi:2',3'-cyclic-nucleotide 2'-phosphodiesterase/3'-nucleotidase